MLLRLALFALAVAALAPPLRAEDDPWTAERTNIDVPMPKLQTIVPASPGSATLVI